ncbi:ENTH/VHS-like protein [Artemisia annua]|uniref:ENTH/VHS-like protein n=1 Tax=Artemisia annua TaxID=35608 RepID=A0A2U1KRE9_ARTAN|nr:ENTH/VHS-like protein [Artemisia annua]
MDFMKVLDATDDEPWGPHGTALAEIAQATKKFSECQMVMGVLWTRLTETDRNWRHVYKALAVIEYLVANGSERAVDDIIEHTFQISDSGINVRKKVENIVSLLNDKDKIQTARNKAAANRDKYVGLSSTGISYKSGSSASFSGGSFQKSDRYGGFGGSRDGETFKDSFKDREQSSEDRFEPGKFKPRREVSGSTPGSSSKNGSSRYGSIKLCRFCRENTMKDLFMVMVGLNILDVIKWVAKLLQWWQACISISMAKAGNVFGLFTVQDSPATGASKGSVNNAADKYSSISATSNNNEDDDFDDFDPRGTSNSRAAAGSSQVDLFGDSLIGDLLDTPTPVPTQDSNRNTPEQVLAPETKPAESNIQSVDPFAAVPMNNFDNSDFFGSFSAHTGSASSAEPTNQSFMDSANSSNNQIHKTSVASSKKDGFQVKSGVWADSLSRGLIDLNISRPKKVDLSDVGIVGGLSAGTEEKEKGLPNSLYMGRAMGTGSGLGKSTGYSTSATADMDDFFSSLSFQNVYVQKQKVYIPIQVERQEQNVNK